MLALALALIGCGDDAAPADSGRSDAARRDGGAIDSGALDADFDAAFDAARPDAGPRPDGAVGAGNAVRFVMNAPGQHEYGLLRDMPPGFGEGELTFELWIRPDGSFPVGSTAGGDDQLRNWSDEDLEPYSETDWWYTGNFLLDGHNNDSFGAGTFSLQFYGRGRVRWMLGDLGERAGGVQAAQAYPATSAPHLLDGAWHRVALVRRHLRATESSLELWIDGDMIASETSTERTDLRRWFDAWDGFREGEEGWFFGAEKQAAVGRLAQYEDYKGDVSEMRFWSVALDPALLRDAWDRAIDASAPGLAGWFPFDEGSGDRVCDALDRSRCMDLLEFRGDPWIAEGPPLR